MYGSMYREQTARWQLGADINGLRGVWVYDDHESHGPNISRQANIRAYGLRPGSAYPGASLAAQPASLAVDWSSLAVGAVLGIFVYPQIIKLLKK
jgi:hypothetical protein